MSFTELLPNGHLENGVSTDSCAYKEAQIKYLANSQSRELLSNVICWEACRLTKATKINQSSSQSFCFVSFRAMTLSKTDMIASGKQNPMAA